MCYLVTLLVTDKHHTSDRQTVLKFNIDNFNLKINANNMVSSKTINLQQTKHEFKPFILDLS